MIRNILMLGVVQVVNYIFPLLLIPYFFTTIGSDGWGKIVLVQSILQYFIVLVTYGFQWSAINRLSIIKNDINKISELFSCYWYAQWVLLFISFILLFIIIELFNNLKVNSNLIFIGFLSVVGCVIFPSWLMQSLGEFKLMSVVQLVINTTSFLLTFILVKTKNDLSYALFLQSINNLLVGIICLYFLFYKRKLRIYKCSWASIQFALKDGFTLFKSQIWIALYTNTIPVVLGFVSDTNSVATYAIADKIQKGFRFLLNPMIRVLFPKISSLQVENKRLARTILNTSIGITAGVSVFTGFLIFIFAEEILDLLGGEHLMLAPLAMRIFSLMPLFVGLSSVISIQGLIPIGKEKVLHNIWFGFSIVVLLLSYVLCSSYGVIGAVSLAVFVEFLIACISLFLWWKHWWLLFLREELIK